MGGRKGRGGKEGVDKEPWECEELFYRVFQQMPYPIEVCAPDGTAKHVNQAFLDMWGVPSRELVIGKYNVFKDPLVKKLGLLDDVKRVYGGETVFLPKIVVPLEYVENKYESKKKGTIIQEMTMFPVFLHSGELWRVVTIWRDVTEREKTEEELKQRLEELERMNRLMVGRELRMRELKGRIKELEARAAELEKGAR